MPWHHELGRVHNQLRLKKHDSQSSISPQNHLPSEYMSPILSPIVQFHLSTHTVPFAWADTCRDLHTPQASQHPPAPQLDTALLGQSTCVPQVPQQPLTHPCLHPRSRPPKHQHDQMHQHASPSCRRPVSNQAPAPSASHACHDSLHPSVYTQGHHCSNLTLTNDKLVPIGKNQMRKERASIPESQDLFPTWSYFTKFICTLVLAYALFSF